MLLHQILHRAVNGQNQICPLAGNDAGTWVQGREVNQAEVSLSGQFIVIVGFQSRQSITAIIDKAERVTHQLILGINAAGHRLDLQAFQFFNVANGFGCASRYATSQNHELFGRRHVLAQRKLGRIQNGGQYAGNFVGPMTNEIGRRANLVILGIAGQHGAVAIIDNAAIGVVGNHHVPFRSDDQAAHLQRYQATQNNDHNEAQA